MSVGSFQSPFYMKRNGRTKQPEKETGFGGEVIHFCSHMLDLR